MSEGVIKSEVFIEEGDKSSDINIHHRTSQPTEDIILNRNKELRRNEGVLQELGSQASGQGGKWGRQVASIPFITFEWAIRNGFDLNCPDTEIAQKELYRFLMTTPEGQACMVTEEKL